jgi:hypothetical protein
MAKPTPHDYDPDRDGVAAAWAFVWILFAFKLVTVGLIFYHHTTVETGMFLVATTWFWFPVIGALVAGPLLFRWRLRRVRARREQLRRAEWMLEQGHDADEGVAGRERASKSGRSKERP